MSFREDWTRIAQSLHGFISTFRSSAGGALGRKRKSKVHSPGVQPAAFSARSTMDARLLTEIERRRAQAYQANVRNQLR